MTSEPGPLDALYETDASPVGTDTAPGPAEPETGEEGDQVGRPETGSGAEGRRRLNIEAIIASGAVW